MSEVPLFREVYGYHSEKYVPQREEEYTRTKSGKRIFASECPFTGFACTKSTSQNEKQDETRPLGVCSASDPNGNAVITCPNRFKTDIVWKDLYEHLFPEADGELFTLNECSLGETGNIDITLVIHRDGDITDFSVVEIQSSYFSGASIREDFNEYMNRVNEGNPPQSPKESRQMDYRSCVDKRLLPQLEEEAEIIERWERKFGVILQKIAFDNSNLVNRINKVEEEDAKFFFFVYDYTEETPQYRLKLNKVYPTTFEKLTKAIGESPAPDEDEFIDYLEKRLSRER